LHLFSTKSKVQKRGSKTDFEPLLYYKPLSFYLETVKEHYK